MPLKHLNQNRLHVYKLTSVLRKLRIEFAENINWYRLACCCDIRENRFKLAKKKKIIGVWNHKSYY